jgi:hypothetical protein
MRVKTVFKNAVKAHLKKLEALFEAELASVIQQYAVGTAKCLQIEYDAQSFDTHFSVCLFAIDADANLVGKVHWFLEDTAVVVPEEIYTSEQFEDIEPSITASSVLENWLIKRWAAVGNHQLPAYLSHHDSYFKRNIATGVEINWDNIMKEINGL